MSRGDLAGAVPDRSVEDRLAALRHANEIRAHRAELKRRLKAGELTIEAVLGDPPEYIEHAKACDVLAALPKFGQVKATRALRSCGIADAKTIGGLSGRQRALLIALLRKR